MASKPKDQGPPDVLAGRNSLVPEDEGGRKLYPTLWSLLLPKWQNGKCVRQAGKIALRIVGPYYLVSVTCPTEGLETTATLATLDGMMEALEKHCLHPGAIWTPTFDRVKEAKREEKEIRKQLKKADS